MEVCVIVVGWLISDFILLSDFVSEKILKEEVIWYVFLMFVFFSIMEIILLKLCICFFVILWFG